MSRWKQKVRAADAMEVGVGNPAEKTFRHPNLLSGYAYRESCQSRQTSGFRRDQRTILLRPTGLRPALSPSRPRPLRCANRALVTNEHPQRDA